MNDESLIEVREKTKETLCHFLNHWLMIIILSISGLFLAAFGELTVFPQIVEIIAIINIFYIGIVCGCFVMYNIFWGKMKTTWQKENKK